MTSDTPAPGEVGSIVELEITNVAHGGIFVARLEGRVVFVADTAPGEVVRARIGNAAHERFLRAEAVEVLRASPHRIPHVWESASIERAPQDRAGGAEFGHLDLAYQRELKGEVLSDALRRMAHLERDVRVEAPAGETADGTGWRTRVRLHVDRHGAVGPYAARSHRVVAVDDLPLATQAVRAAAPLSATLPPSSAVDIVSPNGGEAMTMLAEIGADDGATRRGRGARRAPRPRVRPLTIREAVGGRSFEVDADGFWQVHRLAPETLTRAVQDAIDTELLDPRAANLDLYGGVGLLAAAFGDLAGPATRITTVESDSRATDHAAANLAEWIGAAALTERVDRYLTRLESTASAAERLRLSAATVVLDPPRSGAGATVVESLVRLRPAQLIYVACDPVALARDAGLLEARGYRLQHLRAFDLFPNTHHLEAVARFTR
jgi:tRNA/tmRNA/rRNA uracil-C5-methylase (TrmA/RlmC/RlmD family)